MAEANIIITNILEGCRMKNEFFRFCSFKGLLKGILSVSGFSGV